MQLPDHFYAQRRIEQLVENKTSFTVNQAELNIYETHQEAEKVLLRFSEPVLASMLEGKKVMHLDGREAFNFLPGESICLPADELMCIDFPEAKQDNPTRCLAMQIDHNFMRSIVEEMNEMMPKSDNQTWTISPENYAFTNDQAIYQLLQRMIYVFMEGHPSKDSFINWMMKELIIRIKQTENRENYHNQVLKISDQSRLGYIVNYIREHLHEPLSVASLAEKAHMSEPNFHRVFRDEIGKSPVQFINQARIKRATALLKDPNVKMQEVFLRCGFNSLSYFNRTFKKTQGTSPRKYQQQLSQ